MGKLVVSEFITLDGVIEDPGGAEGSPYGGWGMRFPAPDSERYKFDELLASDVQLLGRKTYDGFSVAWPAMADQAGEFGERMNGMPKVVVSKTLTDPTWTNTTVVSGDVPGAVARLKEQYTGDVLVAGSATLVGYLRRHDLVDEYRLIVNPILVGGGKRLFTDADGTSDLQLVESRKLGPDVLLVVYRQAPVRA